MCTGIKCSECKERYECDYYQAYLGFGKYNVPIDTNRVKKKKSYNLDYYDKKRR